MWQLMMIIIILVCGILLGCSFSQGVVNRRKTLEGIIEALEKMKTYIEFSSMEIFEIIKRSFGNLRGFSDFARIPEDVTFVLWWSKCVSTLGGETGLSKEDKDLLIRFSNGIGVSDVSGQISHIDLYISMFCEKVRLARDEEEKKSRLYKILGFSFGCAVSLIIV